jgi:hypothetical protein
MSDINISNGTCYTAAGERLDDSFIPCGNTAFAYQTCCGAGDNCLADLACFGIHSSGYGSFLTYFAGCTDPDYQDASCPQKEVGRLSGSHSEMSLGTDIYLQTSHGSL